MQQAAYLALRELVARCHQADILDLVGQDRLAAGTGDGAHFEGSPDPAGGESACIAPVILQELLQGARSAAQLSLLRSRFSSLPVLSPSIETYV